MENNNKAEPTGEEPSLADEFVSHEITAAIDAVLPGVGMALDFLSTLFEAQGGGLAKQQVRKNSAKLNSQSSLGL